ncbi:MAG: hypothetical protein LBN02_02790 [Oscillospiraceae bacterium]|jgi:predicted small lipoprotein YifL|nr:hypothetical protein [Oscillospiraceae bacterium]
MKKTLLSALVICLVIICAACGQKTDPNPPTSPTAFPTAPVTDTATPPITPTNNPALRQIDATSWYSEVLGATLDFPDEWEGLFTLETTDSEVTMRLVPPTNYGGMICFFKRESHADWEAAQGNNPTSVEVVAESDEYVIIMTRPGDEQAAPEYREQYYKMADKLSDIAVTFGE